jgi:putative ABC transport system ATP-binding protein
MATIELEGIGREYETGGGTVTALSAVDLSIEAGEFVVVLGPSGSGKTTLLNVIGSLDTPTHGTARVSGRELTGASRSDLFRYRRETVSFIFQTFNLFPALTAFENVRFGADVAHVAHAPDVARERLERVGLGDRLDHFPSMLSGGEQQRVAIARALATGNDVLLADEPTGELDFHTGVQILQLLEEQAAAGSVVVVVTHNREISRTADRVIELSGGRVVSDGPPAGGRKPTADLHW